MSGLNNIFLETDRLVLKTTELSELDNLVALGADPDVMKFLGDDTIQTSTKVKNFINITMAYQTKYHGLGFCSLQNLLPNNRHCK